MVKRRSFQDIDITKDFEKRLEIKQKELQKENFELKKLPLEDMSLKELELFHQNQMNKLEKDIEDDTSSKLLFEDVK
jgi:hypothetical protein